MTTKEAVTMAQQYTATVQAEALSPTLSTALSLRPVHGASYRVTVEEIEESDEEKLAKLRAAIQKGRDEIAAGRVIDGETAFAELAAKHFPHRMK
ncbi:hypothetical protein [Magnetospirillum moscoviense]|uniref:Uncharacterized protein n=1 Tax=Magnetospirillum moscoviense TaxID=1437059 RepID=A0A178MWY0_9PROT|nr:hypothetical protein [Magnetospirillum moscoviense]MBF0327129.1 hypothetical protein [Alphaproteobacteria bacterium]OAN55139.1 hypothetical protein A6A05_00840 [Magnetospirillum moscoviense]